jgi:hypothetical protein
MKLDHCLVEPHASFLDDPQHVFASAPEHLHDQGCLLCLVLYIMQTGLIPLIAIAWLATVFDLLRRSAASDRPTSTESLGKERNAVRKQGLQQISQPFFHHCFLLDWLIFERLSILTLHLSKYIFSPQQTDLPSQTTRIRLAQMGTLHLIWRAFNSL